jgi:hypothetical protein
LCQKNLAKKLAFFTQNISSLCKNMIITSHFFAEKLGEIAKNFVIIPSTPNGTKFRHFGKRVLNLPLQGLNYDPFLSSLQIKKNLGDFSPKLNSV